MLRARRHDDRVAVSHLVFVAIDHALAFALFKTDGRLFERELHYYVVTLRVVLYHSELEDFFSEDEAERVLQVAIEWGRYAEHFAYEEASGILSLENPGRLDEV